MPSSVINRIRYDPPSANLEIEFVSGRAYRYCGVPAELVARFRAAFSKGRFFNRHIRDNFRYSVVETESADPWAIA